MLFTKFRKILVSVSSNVYYDTLLLKDNNILAWTRLLEVVLEHIVSVFFSFFKKILKQPLPELA